VALFCDLSYALLLPCLSGEQQGSAIAQRVHRVYGVRATGGERPISVPSTEWTVCSGETDYFSDHVLYVYEP
jgi:hypothetical protein